MKKLLYIGIVLCNVIANAMEINDEAKYSYVVSLYNEKQIELFINKLETSNFKNFNETEFKNKIIQISIKEPFQFKPDSYKFICDCEVIFKNPAIKPTIIQYDFAIPVASQEERASLITKLKIKEEESELGYGQDKVTNYLQKVFNIIKSTHNEFKSNTTDLLNSELSVNFEIIITRFG